MDWFPSFEALPASSGKGLAGELSKAMAAGVPYRTRVAGVDALFVFPPAGRLAAIMPVRAHPDGFHWTLDDLSEALRLVQAHHVSGTEVRPSSAVVQEVASHADSPVARAPAIFVLSKDRQQDWLSSEPPETVCFF